MFSAGRDGSICRLHFSDSETTPTISGLQRLGDVVSLIEGVRPTSCGLLVHGTRSSNYVVYDTARRCILLEAKCGGSKRAMDLRIDCCDNNQPETLVLAFYKEGVVNVHTTSICDSWSMLTPLGPEFHGREVSTALGDIYVDAVMQVVDASLVAATTDSFQLLTASEDTTIRMMQGIGSELKSLYTLEAHTRQWAAEA